MYMFENFKKRIAIKKAINHTELSIVERSSIVNEVTEKCFIDNNYHPEYIKPMFTLSVLRMFTTISPIMLKNEDGTDSEYVDIEKTYAYCVANHVMDYVVNKCKYGYIDDLFSEVCESIEYKKTMTISTASSVSDKVVTGIVDVLDSIHSAVENMDMGKSKEILDFVSKMNKVPQKQWSDSIVKNLPKKNDKNVQNVLANEQKDNVIPITSPTEDK